MRAAPAVLLLAVLVACAPAGGGRAGGAGPVRLDTPLGRVELPAAADRVVALDRRAAEELLTLGVPPVGATDIAAYRGPERLPPGTADVGPAADPDTAAVAALRPDLVVGDVARHERLLTDLEAVAPTVLFDPSRTGPDPTDGAGDGALVETAAAFRTLGAAVGRREDAERVLVELDQATAAARERLRPGDVVLARVDASAPGPVARAAPPPALATEVLAGIGLDAVALTDTAAPLLHQSADGEAPHGDARWRALLAARRGGVHELSPDAVLDGGPAAALLLVEQVSAALAPEAGRSPDPG